MSHVVLRAIRALGDLRYEVTVEVEGQRKSFVFAALKVDGVEFWQYDEEFPVFLGHNTGPLKPIYQAVSAFHDARRIPWERP